MTPSKIIFALFVTRALSGCDGPTTTPADIHRAACLVEQLADTPLSLDDARDLTIREAERMAGALAACGM